MKLRTLFISHNVLNTYDVCNVYANNVMYHIIFLLHLSLSLEIMAVMKATRYMVMNHLSTDDMQKCVLPKESPVAVTIDT